MKTLITRQSKVERTPRYIQTRDKFGIVADGTSAQTWDVDLALPAEWNVGLIVGGSGAGKTTLARRLVEELGAGCVFVTPKDEAGRPIEPFDWPADQCVVDGFPEPMGINDVVQMLSSVGFSSPPSWLQPYHTLSYGEQFRATAARVLAQCQQTAAVGIIDEFANNVDDTTARIGSAAIEKAVRRAGLKLICVTTREDIAPYLRPDWIVPMVKGEPVRLDRGSLRRPNLELEIVPVDRSAWEVFRGHHYLDHSLHRDARCYAGLIEGKYATFAAVIHWPTTSGLTYREHRVVCLPAFQGVGLGNLMSRTIASLWAATGKPYHSATSHPSLMHARARSPLWKMIRPPMIKACGNAGLADAKTYQRRDSSVRITTTFQYVGPANEVQAKRLRVVG